MSIPHTTRTVGRKTDKGIAFDASGDLLVRGCQFNDEMHRMFSKSSGVLKGVYRFKSHKDANEHQEQCIAEKMAKLAIENRVRNGK